MKQSVKLLALPLALVALSLSLVGCSSAEFATLGSPSDDVVRACREVSTSQASYEACIYDTAGVVAFSPVTDTECLCSEVSTSQAEYVRCVGGVK